MTVSAETPAAIGVGSCDWLAIWRQMHDAERAHVVVLWWEHDSEG